MHIAERLGNLPPYVFAAIGRQVQALQEKGVDVIRLDIGSPDLPPPAAVVETLYRSARDPHNHGYGGFFGQPALRKAIADYYSRRFGVELDPESEVLPLIGSKEGIFHLPMAFVDAGDVVLAPDPGYPTYRVSTQLVDGELYLMPLLAEDGFLPDLNAIPGEVLARARVLWLNYPNNPTTAVAADEFFRRAVDFAREHDILLAHDNPYAETAWDGYVPPSLLQVPGAREVAVEFNSLSKTYHMAGWRVGMVVGNAEVIGALARLKTNVDSGLFRAVQNAAVTALSTTDEAWLVERNETYRVRRRAVTEALDRMGLWYAPSSATLYVWTRVPGGMMSARFASDLLEGAGVSLAPGTAFGPHGEGYVRISLVQPVARLEEAMARWKQWMG
ncbi:MAG TPA: aminotransferase class I/II-fold pyridoxal phosphate-dependent enzyme [Chloroflexi bacterium]|nr:aminotransferase class I/II-fold pyridoxal phosphate-dependent enzyme [Chloroflexota bacterium]